MHILQEYKVFWGGYSQVQVEVLLMEKVSCNHYDYYHLLSGADLPIKSNEYIDEFFEQYNGYEFLAFYKQNAETKRRYKCKFQNEFFTFLERILLVLQIFLRVDRMKKHPQLEIQYGSNWFDIMNSAVSYILSNKQLIEDVFRYTNCAEELLIKSIKRWEKKHDICNCWDT
jgi:hypothetical protein